MKRALGLSLVAAVSLVWGACAAPVDSGLEGEDPGAADYESADTEEARVASWERVRGAWVRSGGFSAYTALVFTSETSGSARKYFGDRAVQCVRAPCDPVRENGTYTVGSTQITFRPSGASAVRVRYALSNEGNTLTLNPGTRSQAVFTREASYCRADAQRECTAQIGTPRCPGSWSCESNACAFHCMTPRTTCAQVRCRAGTVCEESDTGASCVGTYGAACGGSSGVSCGADYICQPDGHCHPLAREGEGCSRAILYPPVCEAGTTCQRSGGSTPVGGASGTCVRN